ncbi:MAG: hypothetical protein FWD98_00970 [Defluviitaleaceae bacterium]|nr:hypothetical protein [Defluviitaleaceae bacterium]
MRTSIYISAEQIQAVGIAKKDAKAYAVQHLPEGVMYNGMIMEETTLSESLAALKKSNPAMFKRPVSLVVDGSSILNRRLITPKLRDKQYLQLVRDDFVDSIGDVNDLVCTYRKLASKKEKEHAILGFAVNKVLIDRYVATFNEAGIKIESMRIGIEMLLEFVKTMPALQQSTVIVNVLDGHIMLSMIFVDGESVFSQRTRLYGEDREQIIGNVADNLNTLLQFVQSQNYEGAACSYYFGISLSEASALQARNTYPGLKIEAFYKRSIVPSEAHFATLDVMFGGKGLDLLKARKALDAYVKSKRPKRTWIALLVLYFTCLAGLAGYLVYEIHELDFEISLVNRFVTAPIVAERQEHIRGLMSDTTGYNNVLEQVDAKWVWEGSMAAAESRIMDFVLFGHGLEVDVTSFSFNENTGVVRINATAADAGVSVDYVHAMYDNGIARDVMYHGFGSNAQGRFTFTVDIYLLVVVEEEGE